MEKKILITNNPLFVQRSCDFDMLCCKTLIQVQEAIRQKLHQGWSFYTPPILGNLKPLQNPYYSVVVVKKKTHIFDDYLVIDNFFTTYCKFEDYFPRDWDQEALENFALLDRQWLHKKLQKLEKKATLRN